MVLTTFLRTRPLFGTQRGARVVKLRDDRLGASCCEGSTSTGAAYVFMLVSICDFLRCRQWTSVFLLCVRVREKEEGKSDATKAPTSGAICISVCVFGPRKHNV
ncbi:hypothetical protein FCV25MIE_13322 [Fagus crenata]